VTKVVTGVFGLGQEAVGDMVKLYLNEKKFLIRIVCKFVQSAERAGEITVYRLAFLITD